MDDQQRERIRDDLRGVIRGDLHFDAPARALYSTDASIFQLEPAGVVVPRDEEDLQALVRYAAAEQLPLIPRGGGSGMAGEALGWGIVVDLSRYFRSIIELKDDCVRVQTGVVCQELNSWLAARGRRLGPDPASSAQCTIGGMLATNASGAQALRYGYMRDYVEGLRLVLDDGEAVVVTSGMAGPDDTSSPRLQEILRQVEGLVSTNAGLIQERQPRTPWNRCGYLLHDVHRDGHLDLARVLVGSEGTLAFFTEVTLRTVPLPEGHSLVLAGFESLEAAVRATQRALPLRPAACELIDRRLLALTRDRDGDAGGLVPPAAEAILLIEFEAETQAEAREKANALLNRLLWTDRLAVHGSVALTEEEIHRVWQLRERALPALYGLRGGSQPVAFVEDVGVPQESLAGFLYQVQDILQRHQVTASFLVHAGTGQVHTRPFLDLQQPADVAKLWILAEEIHLLTLSLGGTVSSQHGTGLARTPWVSRQYGPLYPVMRELKAIFDPRNLLNPGKIIGPDPGHPAWPLRRALTQDAEPESRQLVWKPDEIRRETAQCNGCGHCRTLDHHQRMCPIHRATHAEAAAPRAKANLLRHLLEEGGDPRQLSSDEVRAVADLCVNCRMCARECPAGVNIPKLMLEVKGRNVAEHGLNRADWVLARTESFAAVGSRFAMLINPALASPAFRWLGEKIFGIARSRRLPAFAPRTFLSEAARRGWTRPLPSGPDRVAYFVDVFANFNDPSLGAATVAVLQHNGIPVYVPPGQQGCGMAPLAHGDVDTARESAIHNLRIFAELARQGYRIVCSEPTAALMLTQDYPDLVDDADARQVAAQTVELTTFLWELYTQGRLKTDLQPLELAIGQHVPCHLKALAPPPAARQLLSLIPSLRVRTIDVSCSGMAGTFGLKAANHALSLAAGAPMLEEMNHPRVLFGATECSPCRLQMEDGSGKRTLHPVQYLALSYGLMPELADRLREPLAPLVS